MVLSKLVQSAWRLMFLFYAAHRSPFLHVAWPLQLSLQLRGPIPTCLVPRYSCATWSELISVTCMVICLFHSGKVPLLSISRQVNQHISMAQTLSFEIIRFKLLRASALTTSVTPALDQWIAHFRAEELHNSYDENRVNC